MKFPLFGVFLPPRASKCFFFNQHLFLYVLFHALKNPHKQNHYNIHFPLKIPHPLPKLSPSHPPQMVSKPLCIIKNLSWYTQEKRSGGLSNYLVNFSWVDNLPNWYHKMFFSFSFFFSLAVFFFFFFFFATKNMWITASTLAFTLAEIILLPLLRSGVK